MKEIVKSQPTEIKIYGQTFSLSKPKVGQLKKFQAEMSQRKTEDAEITELIQEFLASLGLPKEFSNEMETEHLMVLLNGLSEAWTGEKKT